MTWQCNHGLTSHIDGDCGHETRKEKLGEPKEEESSSIQYNQNTLLRSARLATPGSILPAANKRSIHGTNPYSYENITQILKSTERRTVTPSATIQSIAGGLFERHQPIIHPNIRIYSAKRPQTASNRTGLNSASHK